MQARHACTIQDVLGLRIAEVTSLYALKRPLSVMLQVRHCGIGSSVYSVLQAVECPPAVELAQATPSVAESVPCPHISASEHSCPAQTEGTDQTSPDHTALLYGSEQDVQLFGVSSGESMPPVVVSIHGSTAQAPKAAGVVSDDAAMMVVTDTEAAQILEVAVTADSSEGTAIITASEAVAAASTVTIAAATTAAITAATTAVTIAAAATSATMTVGTTAEAMALPVAHAVAEAAAGGMNLLLVSQSLPDAWQPPSCADSFNGTASTAVSAVATGLSSGPAAVLTELADAVVTDTAKTAAVTALAKAASDKLSQECLHVELAVSMAVDPAAASTQLSRFPRENHACITASAAVPAQLDGTAGDSVNSSPEAGSLDAVGTDSVPAVCTAQAEGTHSVPEAGGVKADGIDSVPKVCSAQADVSDSAVKARSAETEGLDHVPDAGSVAAEGFDETDASGDYFACDS